MRSSSVRNTPYGTGGGWPDPAEFCDRRCRVWVSSQAHTERLRELARSMRGAGCDSRHCPFVHALTNLHHDHPLLYHCTTACLTARRSSCGLTCSLITLASRTKRT